MPAALLVTQCLQNDFVKPITRFEPIPNKLHVGFSEARRLMGEVPAEGPVARTMRWAYDQPDERLQVIHIRDWHDTGDAVHRAHLDRFGEHCLRDTPGAAFAFPEVDEAGKHIEIIDSLTLNDFVGTRLEEILRSLSGVHRKVGLVGVWTEAKISFLAYELCTRFPEFEVAVCSALTASSTRAHHFEALDHLDRILGVRVIDSVGDFLDFLGGEGEDAPLLGLNERYPRIDVDGTLHLTPTDETLLRYLFRDCRELGLEVLDGGYSGNVVVGTESVDFEGRDQVPHVVKIGPQDLMGRERTSFERVQAVLGNNAPHIADFADYGDRGAIKYRYASMGGAFSTTFQKAYMRGLSPDEVQEVIDTVFGEQLMRLYKAATLEDGDLLDHYWFAPRWGASVQRAVAALLGEEAAVSDPLEVVAGVRARNVVRFYTETLAHSPRRPGQRFYQAYVHGDLNGANIIIDGHGNVWIIDFFHTRRAHVLMDLVKLENDLLYIWTPIADDGELREACAVTDALMAVTDLAAPLPERAPSDLPQLQRAWSTIRMLRAYYPTLLQADRDAYQLQVAQLRYAAHTLGFDEPDVLQRRWALYTACRAAERITERLLASTRLRVDWVDDPRIGPGRVGITLLPGRKDHHRDLAADLATLREVGVERILTLVPAEELRRYGVGSLLEALRAAGFDVHHFPLLDQKATTTEEMAHAVAWVEAGVQTGASVLVHCVGGLGRSGMVVASFLVSRGASAEEALAAVRRARGPRCVETAVQEAFVREFAG